MTSRTSTLALFLLALGAQAQPTRTVDQILADYVKALGGAAAIDRIKTRELTLTSGHLSGGVKLQWSAPDKVLRTEKHELAGYDGSSGWFESKRKRLQKLPKARVDEMETDANPIRYTRLKELYHDVSAGGVATLDGKLMDVIVCPNSLGTTKLFFDRTDHLLYRIEEFGVDSAYFKHTTQFSDYKELDGIRLPFRIERESEEPGTEHGDVRLAHVKQNVPIDGAIFRKPEIGRVITGGKH